MESYHGSESTICLNDTYLLFIKKGKVADTKSIDKFSLLHPDLMRRLESLKDQNPSAFHDIMEKKHRISAASIDSGELIYVEHSGRKLQLRRVPLQSKDALAESVKEAVSFDDASMIKKGSIKDNKSEESQIKDLIHEISSSDEQSFKQFASSSDKFSSMSSKFKIKKSSSNLKVSNMPSQEMAQTPGFGMEGSEAGWGAFEQFWTDKVENSKVEDYNKSIVIKEESIVEIDESIEDKLTEKVEAFRTSGIPLTSEAINNIESTSYIGLMREL